MRLDRTSFKKQTFAQAAEEHQAIYNAMTADERTKSFKYLMQVNYVRLQNAFEDFGLPLNAITLDDFLSNEKVDVFTFGRPPVAIDI